MNWFDETIAVETDVVLAVRDAGGTGPAILFVNGLGSPQRVWDPVAKHLRGSHRLVSYDMRGMGRTKATQSADDYDTHLADLDRLREHLGVPVTLVGWSFGAQLAIESAASTPENCTGVVALDGGIPIDRPAPVQEKPPSLFTRIAMGLANLLGAGHRLTPDQLDRLVAALEEHEQRLDATYDRLSCPVTVVFGTRRSPHEPADLHRAALEAADRFEERHPAIPFVRLDSDHTLILRLPAEIGRIIAHEDG